MMDGLHRRIAKAGSAMAPDGHDPLCRAKALFERAIWLIRRSVLALDAPETG